MKQIVSNSIYGKCWKEVLIKILFFGKKFFGIPKILLEINIDAFGEKIHWINLATISFMG